MNGTVVDPGVAVKWVLDEEYPSRQSNLDGRRRTHRTGTCELNPHKRGPENARLKDEGIAVWALIASLGGTEETCANLADALDVYFGYDY